MKPGNKDKNNYAFQNLILSIFPGIDLLGRAFEEIGFCIVRGPDKLWGGDIRNFSPPAGIFEGVIGGPPCQDFSGARRAAPTGEGLEMLDQFARVVIEAAPEWYLLENVNRVPDLKIEGYSYQRIDLNSLDCGSLQRRNRVFQFGHKSNYALLIDRIPRNGRAAPICMAREGTAQGRRSWGDFCELMDLPRDFDLPGWSLAAKYRAVGNGVPLKMGRVIARGIKDLRYKIDEINLCACGCGRLLTGRQKSASSACRKRLQRKREKPA